MYQACNIKIFYSVRKSGLVKTSIMNTILSINNPNFSHQSVENRDMWQLDFDSGTGKSLLMSYYSNKEWSLRDICHQQNCTV